LRSSTVVVAVLGSVVGSAAAVVVDIRMGMGMGMGDSLSSYSPTLDDVYIPHYAHLHIFFLYSPGRLVGDQLEVKVASTSSRSKWHSSRQLVQFSSRNIFSGLTDNISRY
jgi:hypothetical protein